MEELKHPVPFQNPPLCPLSLKVKLRLLQVACEDNVYVECFPSWYKKGLGMSPFVYEQALE